MFGKARELVSSIDAIVKLLIIFLCCSCSRWALLGLHYGTRRRAKDY